MVAQSSDEVFVVLNEIFNREVVQQNHLSIGINNLEPI